MKFKVPTPATNFIRPAKRGTTKLTKHNIGTHFVILRFQAFTNSFLKFIYV